MAEKNKTAMIITLVCIICFCLTFLNIFAKISMVLYMNIMFREINSDLLIKKDFHNEFLKEIQVWKPRLEDSLSRIRREINLQDVCKIIDENCPREVGLPGQSGVKGPKGDTGYPGITGLRGLSGGKGLPGIKGLKGDKGDPGPIVLPPSIQLVNEMFKGAPGDDGPPGVTGPPGYPCSCKN